MAMAAVIATAASLAQAEENPNAALSKAAFLKTSTAEQSAQKAETPEDFETALAAYGAPSEDTLGHLWRIAEGALLSGHPEKGRYAYAAWRFSTLYNLPHSARVLRSYIASTYGIEVRNQWNANPSNKIFTKGEMEPPTWLAAVMPDVKTQRRKADRAETKIDTSEEVKKAIDLLTAASRAETGGYSEQADIIKRVRQSAEGHQQTQGSSKK